MAKYEQYFENGHLVNIGEVLDLVIEPDERLHQVSKPVDIVDDIIRKEIDNITASMLKHRGVGLASVQVGIMKRILVMDCASLLLMNKIPSNSTLPAETTLLRMINPTIVKNEGSDVAEEACLSVPEINVEVFRPTSITVEYIDYWGNQQNIHLDGWLARCFLHELDHINGITLLNKLSPLKKNLALKKLHKLQKKIT
jgi:peptide deformylase